MEGLHTELAGVTTPLSRDRARSPGAPVKLQPRRLFVEEEGVLRGRLRHDVVVLVVLRVRVVLRATLADCGVEETEIFNIMYLVLADECGAAKSERRGMGAASMPIFFAPLCHR